ncbi:uncharacterized protein LOC116200307 [Punica granatum]|uniref:C2H2-type domain-containing protein n=2 Tax=Punica granatum TaxID=22663 RepID=A0A218W102_PUNGR|nr:uncharacterized protein LOC116200307 [Punica granatum]OWM66504.1 hypothetical protein CDL15_Pgr013721 [Punica granatum]PKI67336.1 hypothetical protein CRG98_012285 [Punica granatum]
MTHKQQGHTGPSAGGDDQGGEEGSPPCQASPRKDQASSDQGADDVPVPQPLLDTGESVGQQAQEIGGEGPSTGRGKKRGRLPKGKEVASEAAALMEAERPKKKVEFDAPEVPRPCSVCGKQFTSYKALFGHMRSHPDRLWRGAFPPPSASPPSSPGQDIVQQGEQLASSLLSIGQRMLEATNEASDETATTLCDQSTRGANPRGLDIDLNMPLDPIPSEPSSPVKEAGGNKEIDLNKEASDDSEGNNQ